MGCELLSLVFLRNTHPVLWLLQANIVHKTALQVEKYTDRQSHDGEKKGGANPTDGPTHYMNGTNNTSTHLVGWEERFGSGDD